MASEPKLYGMEAAEMPREVTAHLRAQDASLVAGIELGQQVDLAVRGEVSSISVSEGGVHLCVRLGSIQIQKPEAAKFVDQVKNLKILKS